MGTLLSGTIVFVIVLAYWINEASEVPLTYD